MCLKSNLSPLHNDEGGIEVLIQIQMLNLLYLKETAVASDMEAAAEDRTFFEKRKGDRLERKSCYLLLAAASRYNTT